MAGGGGVAHSSPSGQQTGCMLQCLVAFAVPVSVCSWTALTEEQGSRHMAGTSLHVSNRLYGQGAAGTVYSICSSGSGHQSAAPMTSGYLFTASLVMEEEPEV